MPLTQPVAIRPSSHLLYHGAATGTFSPTPLTAGTVEPANAPQMRTVADLANATQMRLVVGQRVVGVGGTTCEARVQYATNGVTQTTWADANGAGSGLSLQGGAANVLRDTGWVTLAAGAKIDGAYLRFVITITGTVTTAPTIARVEVQFR